MVDGIGVGALHGVWRDAPLPAPAGVLRPSRPDQKQYKQRPALHCGDNVLLRPLCKAPKAARRQLQQVGNPTRKGVGSWLAFHSWNRVPWELLRVKLPVQL